MTSVQEGAKLWYKDAVIYEVRVRSFADSDGDGVGDFRGLTEKLDYMKDLGITAIWLLPFYPSPLKDDGYDISDYESVNADMGTLDDFKKFLAEAHKRGLKVITELVLNHTSDQHAWFKRARRAPPGDPYRDFYVWSDDVTRYSEARIIFKDFENSNWTFDPVAKSHYWHRFFSHQPDLNFDNPAVHKAIMGVLDFWLDLGVDGFRLDAVPYLYEREGTNCENLNETHGFLKELRAHVDAKYSDRMLLAEANQWPEEAVNYFGNGDECQMAFHFPIMPRMFMGIHMEDRQPLIEILAQTPAIPDNCQWALFLRNHDELTLEMVTDEERDYMYKVYAQDPTARINLGIRRRLAPLLGNHRRKMELMNGLLLSLPGTPVLYYGDEIGMGDNIYLGDRNGVRTPMQWSSDKNAGFSRANPQKLLLPIIIDPEYHYEAINVEAQLENQHSLLRWTKHLIAIRKQYKAMSRGTIEFLYPDNTKVLTFIRRIGNERVLVVANLSRFVQFVELDLSSYKGLHPVEIFGRIEFPPIGDLPYFVTLGPHNFYWFSLESPRVETVIPELTAEAPVLTSHGDWTELLDSRAQLEALLPGYVRNRRWFASKSRAIQLSRIIDFVELPGEPKVAFVMTHFEFNEGRPEDYQLILSCLDTRSSETFLKDHPEAVIARVSNAFADGRDGVLVDASSHPQVARVLFQAFASNGNFTGLNGTVASKPLPAFLSGTPKETPEAKPMKGEQSNTSVSFGDVYIMKLIRRLESGVNADDEISRFLTERAHFKHSASLASSLSYRSGRNEPVTFGLLFDYVPNKGTAWKYALESLREFLAKGMSLNLPAGSLTKLAEGEIVAPAVGPFLASAALLGRRTAELHLALSSDSEDPVFRPEPLSPFVQRSMYQSLRGLNRKIFQILSRRLPTLPPSVVADAKRVAGLESRIHDEFSLISTRAVRASQIRVHGDYHLGQVLWNGSDFSIIDFEGEPARSLTERRLKRSGFKDVAGMIRSFHYAAYTDLGSAPDPKVEKRAVDWFRAVSAAFLRAYFETSAGSVFLPSDRSQRELLLRTYLLEKAVYELGYELNNRPDWVHIPIRGILSMIDEDEKEGES